MATKETLSVFETAAFTGISIQYTYVLVRSGQLKAKRDDHGEWRVDREAAQERREKTLARNRFLALKTRKR